MQGTTKSDVMNWAEWRRKWRFKASLVFVLTCLFVCLVSKYRKQFSYRQQGRSCLPNLRHQSNSDKSHKSDGETRIPRILHQTWSSDLIPFLFEDWMWSWIHTNPDWEFWFWTDDDIHRLIYDCYPQFLETFDSYPTTGYRADVFRYFVLYEFGGFYADIDTEALQSLDTVAKENYCILAQEPLEHAHFLGPVGIPLVSNAVMGCVKGHKFMKQVINNLDSHTGFSHWTNILYATGPYMLTYEYHRYGQQHGRHDVTLSDPDVFMPTIDTSMVRLIKDTCLSGRIDFYMWAEDMELRRTLCNRLMSRDFDNIPRETSLTNHHWTHTWATARHDPWGVKNMRKFFHVQELWRKGLE